MNVSATAKFIGTSSRKMGLVAGLIRGKKATDAITVLDNTAKRATDPVGKVLRSAIANAENNFKLQSRDLVIESVFVGPGPTLKRFRPRAQGRAGSIRKRSSHITVVLTDTPVVSKRAALKLERDAAHLAKKVKPTTASAATPTTKEAK